MQEGLYYTIGDKQYSREELLNFGRRHYPKFYWINRGIGIGLLVIGLILFTAFTSWILATGFPTDPFNRYSIVFYLVFGGLLAIGGAILIMVSFIRLPDESYIKHAIDYYTKLDRQNQRIEARKAQRSGGVTPDQLLKYKELLDKGAITQEEFDAKKKELL